MNLCTSKSKSIRNRVLKNKIPPTFKYYIDDKLKKKNRLLACNLLYSK